MPHPFAPCDVVALAEFDRWETAAAAEARALFLLASWTERARGGDCPLHLVSIGAPPASVATLAEQAGARLRVCERGAVNALHALETNTETGRVLLVSADTVVLRAPAEWGRGPVQAELLLVPANKPPKLPPDWPALYPEVGAAAPEAEDGWPFYQAGTLWTSDPARLRERWARALQAASDERVALTLAAEAPGRLPGACCARLADWETGVLTPGNVALFQAAGLFQGLIDVSEIPARLDLYGARLDAAVQAGFSAAGWWARWRAQCEVRGVRRFLRRLLQRHVAPALRESGAYV